MDSLIIFIHVIAGTVLVFTSAIMQIIVGPAIATIKDAEAKRTVTEKMKRIRIPVMDSAIIIQILSGFYLLHARWNMIANEPVMQVKAVAGIAALSLASLAHFYLRGKKVKLESEGKKEEVVELNQRNRVIERLVLAFGSLTYLLGVYFNHM